MAHLYRRWLLLTIAATALPALTGAQAPADPRALALQGATALTEHRFDDALDAFTAAAAKRPRDASLPYGAGLAAALMGRDSEAEEFFTRALVLQPTLVDASRELGEVQYRSGRLADAIATYEAALAGHPNDRTLLDRLDEWRAEARLHNRFNQTRGQHFRVLFEGPEDQALAQRIIDALERQYRRIGELLHSYPDHPIEVVLYTHQQFHDVTRSPAWAGGLYDGRIRLPARGVDQQIDDLERVLAHEFVHAVVTGVGGPYVPGWIHEGLATALEPGEPVDEARAVLARSRGTLSLNALVDSFGRMNESTARVAYATSTVAVRRMIELRGPDAVVLLLKDLSTGTAFPDAFRRRMGMFLDEFQGALR